MEWEYLRRVMLAASLVLGAVLLIFFASPFCVVCFWVAAYIIWASIKQPDNIFALQEDARNAEKRRNIDKFIETMNRGHMEQGAAAEDYEIICESVSPLVFVFTSSAYGATAEHMAAVCANAAPVFGAIRYTMEQTTTNDQNALEYRIAFYTKPAAETAAALSVDYKDISDIKPRYDAVPVGLFEDGSTAFVSFKNRNMLLSGLPRMGKSCLLSIIGLGLIRCGKSERLIVLSPKILDFQAFKNHAELYETPQQILAAVQSVNMEIEKRKKYCIKNRIKKMPEPTEQEPHIVILIDEYAVIKASKIPDESGKKWRKIGEEIEAEITKIVAQGGFANCQTVITSQRLSSQVISTDLRELIAGNAVSFAQSRQTSSEFVFGEMWEAAPAHEIPITAQGVAYIYTEGTMSAPKIMKAAYMSDEAEQEAIEAFEESERE